jgi:thiamine biosynthesis lipoprotein
MLHEQLMRSEFSSYDGYHRMSFDAMGTVNEITFSAASTARAMAFRDAVFDWLSDFESKYSVYIDDSLISEINRQSGLAAVAVDPMTDELLALCHWYNWKTRGLFDATSGPLIKLWDFHRKHDALPGKAEIDRARERVGWQNVERSAGQVKLGLAGMILDFGGIGKEYAVDCLARMAAESGIADILVNLGRDIRGAGHPPEGGGWRVGLERPDGTNRCWAGVCLDNMSICCSGHYARCFFLDGVRYSHIINPLTGYPSSVNCDAVWVLSPSCVEAGMLSTTAALLECEDALRLISSEMGASGCYWNKGGRYETRLFSSCIIRRQKAVHRFADGIDAAACVGVAC